MAFVTSTDGTRIGYTSAGSGPAIILIEGAMCYRTSGAWDAVADLLKDRFTCITYDRRGRGESGDTLPYAPGTGNRGHRGADRSGRRRRRTLAGLSSGGALALAAADRLAGCRAGHRLRGALCRRRHPCAVAGRLPHLASKRRLRENRRGDALKIFMRRVGVPGFMLPIMPLMPMWKRLKVDRAYAELRSSRLVETHSARAAPAARHLAQHRRCRRWSWTATRARPGCAMRRRPLPPTSPGAVHKTLAGQTHMVKPEPLAAAIAEFMP